MSVAAEFNVNTEIGYQVQPDRGERPDLADSRQAMRELMKHVRGLDVMGVWAEAWLNITPMRLPEAMGDAPSMRDLLKETLDHQDVINLSNLVQNSVQTGSSKDGAIEPHHIYAVLVDRIRR